MGSMLGLSAELPNFTMRDYNDEVKLQWTLLWGEIIRDMLQEILDEIPNITGDTRRAFSDVASHYGVSLGSFQISHAYEFWKHWDHQHYFQQVQHDFDYAFDGELVTFRLDNLPYTFDYNTYKGTKYVRYWEGPDEFGEYTRWTNRESGLGLEGEPWTFLQEAVARAKQRLREASPLVFNKIARGFMKVKSYWRRRRYH